VVAGVAVGPPPKENGFAAAGAGVDAEVVAGNAEGGPTEREGASCCGARRRG